MRADRTKLLITAAEAFPALEAAFLETEERISAGFRVFDPATRLRSDAARATGECWFDLIADTLARGVRIRLVLSDFDPVLRPDLHRGTWRSVRQLRGAAECAGRPDLLDVIPAMHPARTGLLPRLPLWPAVLREVAGTAERLNGMPGGVRATYLRETPKLRPWLREVANKLAAARWPIPPLVPATHHQKLAVFDGKQLYIGGLDLDDRRYDDPAHDRPGEETWHDIQLMMDGGPAPAEAEAHLGSFLDETRGVTPPRKGKHLLRTLSTARANAFPYLSPRPALSEIAERLHAEIARAERLIYIETQFLRCRRVTGQLEKAAAANPDLGLLAILPGAPEDVAFNGSGSLDARYGEYLQAQCVSRIARAFGERAFFGSPALPRRGRADGRGAIGGSPIVYVHAKLSVFDDRCAVVSSANLNGRSLYWDTEAGVALDDPETVADLRRRCFAHILPQDAPAAAFDPATAVATWRDIARNNVEAAPDGRRGFLVPYPVAPARRFGRNLPGIPETMV